MNEKKLKQLFAAARKEPAPPAPGDFAGDILRAVLREPAGRAEKYASVFDQLNRWFPRLGLVAAAIIILCVAADWGLTQAGVPGLSDGTAQITSQYLFTPEDL